MKRIAILLFFFISSCFGGMDKRGSVTGYSAGRVITEGGSFQVGELSSDWVKKDLNFRAAVFGSKKFSGVIGVDAFCKGSFDDAPLKLLARQLTYGMTKVRKMKESNLHLGNRDAFRLVSHGEVDGAPVVLDAVVLKMNECVFDFFYSVAPEEYVKGLNDFEHFFGGFKYLKGPSIDK